MAGYIVDNSVWGRIDHNKSVENALWTAASSGVIYSCTPQRLEFLYSGQGASGFTERQDFLNRVSVKLVDEPAVAERAEEIQYALAQKGKLRAVGAFDILIAAYAYVQRATVLHYDSDFDHLTEAVPDLQTQWVVPRGSVT